MGKKEQQLYDSNSLKKMWIIVLLMLNPHFNSNKYSKNEKSRQIRKKKQ